MFARVSTYQGETEQLVEGFRRTTEPVAQLEGFERAYFLTDSSAVRTYEVTVTAEKAALR